MADGSRLEFPVLEARHEGWYICSTSHSLGNFSSVGYYLSVQRPAGPASAIGSTGRPSGLARVVVESGGSAPLCEQDSRAPRLSAAAGPVRCGVVRSILEWWCSGWFRKGSALMGTIFLAPSEVDN